LGNIPTLFVRVNDRLGANPLYRETNVSGIYPPLGIAYLAASCKKAGYPAAIIDAHGENLSRKNLISRIIKSGADFVGFFATTFNWPQVARTVSELKKHSPATQVWAGGPQLSLFSEICLEESLIDGAVVGEGEIVLPRILKRLETGDVLSDIPGVLFKKDGAPIYGPDSEIIQDIDKIPMPALELLPINRYRAITIPKPFITMITSRGCPYKCRYCSQIYVGGKYRQHSAGRVVDEMIRGKDMFKAKEIVFFDESFTVDKERVLKICHRIQKCSLEIQWNIRTRADRLDQELMPALKKAGCYGIHIGIESGVKRIQKLMNKNLNLDKVKSVVENAKKNGLLTRGYFMIGYPEETLDEMNKTMEFAKSIGLDWASFSITVPNPGTPIFMEGSRENRFDKNYWKNYSRGNGQNFIGYFTSREIDEKTLISLLNRGYRKFYLRPGIILSKLLNKKLWITLPRTLLILSSLFFAKLKMKISV